MTVREIVENSEPFPILNGRNLAFVRWYSGYLLVTYHRSRDAYVYGPDVPEAKVLSLRKVPYPDSLFTKWREKYAWKCHKVPNAANTL